MCEPITPVEPRDPDLTGHRVSGIPVSWWQAEITQRGLPGEPPTTATLSRSEVWSATDDVFTLLWRSLAWGSGDRLRHAKHRLDAIAADVPATKALLTRAKAAVGDPAQAYDVLRPSRRTAIKYLGPSFFTKFLYFAGGGDPQHRCLILDRVVATGLRRRGCDLPGLHPDGPWSTSTYVAYCDLLADWARDRGCAADQFELALFRA
ncbi:hypothetical protein D5S17_29565 [Pseudonocardiaceae bacterium YIM PH 21723]|nr:hypothetical protein D5S17_29565 [Pseudonocardiaceae bacterium YIM PH 21723]